MLTRSLPSRRREKAPRGENLLIGAYLKHARLNRRRSLRQLSDEVGCSESFLSKVENDKLRPSLAMLHRIVSALGVSIGKLFVAGNGADPTVTVVKADSRPILKTGHLRSGKGIALEALVPTSIAILLEANIHRVAPGGSSRGLNSTPGGGDGICSGGQNRAECPGQEGFRQQR